MSSKSRYRPHMKKKQTNEAALKNAEKFLKNYEEEINELAKMKAMDEAILGKGCLSTDTKTKMEELKAKLIEERRKSV